MTTKEINNIKKRLRVTRYKITILELRVLLKKKRKDFDDYAKALCIQEKELLTELKEAIHEKLTQ